MRVTSRAYVTHAPMPVRRTHPVRRTARLLAVLGLEGAAAFALIAAISTSSSPTADAQAAPELSADDVAAAPAEFRSRSVTVAGRIRPRPTRVAEQDRRAFVLEGARDGRLLVVPAKDAKLPAYRPGTAVLVRGDVVIPPSSRRLARRVASRTAVAERARATAILKAVDVEVVR